MVIEINEMRLTAYALGELYGAERAAVEAHLADHPKAQRFVNEMRDTARLVSNELAHEPVVGLLAVHHAAIERHLDEVERLNQPLRLHHSRTLPLRARLRNWTMVGLSAAAAVVIVGGAIALMGPHFYGPVNQNTRVAKGTPQGSSNLPDDHSTVSNPTHTPLAQTGNPKTPTPDPFQRPEPVAAVADHGPKPATNTQSPTPSDAVADSAIDDAGTIPFGPPPTDVAPRGKRPRPAEDVARAGAAHGGAQQTTESAPGTFTRSDDNRGVENYAGVLENRFVLVNESPVSTFAVNVDSSASYLAARRAISAGRRVSPADVRVEEFLNYFNYDYGQPKGDAAVAANIEVADCPWNSEHRLVRIGLRGKDAAQDKRPQAGNIVLLVDLSGSMSAENRLPLLKQAIRSLVKTMTPADRLSIVTYGGAAGAAAVTLAPTSGRETQKILDAIEALSASGASASGDAAIDLAYKTVAQSQALVRGVHRVVLCTADDFTAGLADQLHVSQLVQEKAKANIGLSVIGVGAARLNDPSMRSLARRALGTYAAADTLSETTRALTAAAMPASPVIAKGVQVHVEFNPLIAEAYRLIGYENGPASTKDAAGDNMAAGHMTTALYEVIPAGNAVPGVQILALKYSKRNGFQPLAEGKSDELLTLKLDYRIPDDGKPARGEDRNGRLLEFAVKDTGASYGSVSPDFRFAAAVAEFALVLKGSEHRGNADLERVARLATEAAGNDKAKAEFADLVRKTIDQSR